MKKRVTVLALLLSGCATPYAVPTTPPPPLWSGQAGLVPLVETLATLPGEKKEGDAILRIAVDRARTGVIAADVPYKDAFGGQAVIPSGTPVYAAQYSLMRGSAYSPMQNANAVNNPIEWCTAPPAGEVRCLFWETDSQVRVIPAAGSPLVESMFITTGMPAPMPQIVEQDVNFGVTVSQEVRISRLRKNHVGIADVIARSDGPTRRISDINVSWDGKRQATVSRLGGIFLLTAVGDPQETPTAVKVEVLRPPGPSALKSILEGSQAGEQPTTEKPPSP